MFAVTIMLLVWQMENKDGFNIIWKYFGWANQTLSVFTLWAITVYLTQKGKCYWISLVPAVFMTIVSMTFLCISGQALGLNAVLSYTVGILSGICTLVAFLRWKKKR